MDHSPLAKLPAELRLEIYGKVFKTGSDLLMTARPWRAYRPAYKRWRVYKNVPSYQGDMISALPKNILALASTCRLIRNEAWPVFFGANDWIIPSERVGEDGDNWRDWLMWLGLGSDKWFRCVEVHFTKDDYLPRNDDEMTRMQELVQEMLRRFKSVAHNFDPSSTAPTLILTGLDLPVLSDESLSIEEDEPRWEPMMFRMQYADLLSPLAIGKTVDAFVIRARRALDRAKKILREAHNKKGGRDLRDKVRRLVGFVEAMEEVVGLHATETSE